MGNFISCEQRSEEWYQHRAGKFTASRVIELLPGKTGKYLAGRQNYIHDVACEILTGNPQESGFVSAAMQHGIDTEPLAREEYEFRTGYMVSLPGIVLHDNMEFLAGSPDGFVELEEKGLEIKCPMTKQHVIWYLGGAIDRKYIVQMHVNMICCGVESWDFVSFDPHLPEKSQYFQTTVTMDHALENQIIKECMTAWAEVKALVKQLQ